MNDSERNAFLFSLDLREKMVPVTDKFLIYCCRGSGPVFGSGCDLVISDSCHTNSKSSAIFPCTYNKEGPNKYVNNQNSYTAFSGATNGYNFRVV